MIARVAMLALLALALVGCTLIDTAPEDLSFKYQARGGNDEMDQFLEIVNDGPTAVVPTLEITPLDAAGDPMPGVRVLTAFGSERGGRVLPAYLGDYDVLRFDGPGARDVRDVSVTVKDLKTVDYPQVDADIEVQRLDAGGEPVGGGEPFDSVRLTNPNRDAMPVRIVLIGWEDPPPGKTQQADYVVPLGGLVTLPAKGTQTIQLPPDLGNRIVASVKVYPAR